MGDEEPSNQPAKKEPTAEDFITHWALYTPYAISVAYTPPDRISYNCAGVCAKETTWAVHGRGSYAGFTYVQYQCTLCGKSHLVVIYKETRFTKKLAETIHGREEIWSPTHISKIGQYPPQSIDIPKALEKNLGHHAAFYKKALINRNEGYGLGAVSYMRRVVEDKTEELIEVVAQLAESHQIDAQIVKQIRAAKDQKTTYDNKLKIASAVFPSSLLFDGVNPLDVLFGLVSAGLHDLTEEQCIEIADETKRCLRVRIYSTSRRNRGAQRVRGQAQEMGER